MDPWSKLFSQLEKLLFRMISSRNLYNVKFNGIELESKLLKTTSEREIATSLNFINLGIDLHFPFKVYSFIPETHNPIRVSRSVKGFSVVQSKSRHVTS